MTKREKALEYRILKKSDNRLEAKRNLRILTNATRKAERKDLTERMLEMVLGF